MDFPDLTYALLLVNGKHEKETYVLKQGDRIGIFPLIAGG